MIENLAGGSSGEPYTPNNEFLKFHVLRGRGGTPSGRWTQRQVAHIHPSKEILDNCSAGLVFDSLPYFLLGCIAF